MSNELFPQMLTETELLEIFPQGREILIEKAKEKIAGYEYWLKRNNIERQRVRAEMAKDHYEKLWIRDWWMELDDIDRARLNKEIGHQIWKIKMLKGQTTNTKGITDEDIYQAKQFKIESLYRAGRLRKVGNKLTGKCPFHQEKTGSFHIYLTQNSWWCFGCNQGGSVVDFVMKTNNIPFIEAIKYLLQIR